MVNINANLILGGSLQGWYGSGSATNYAGNDVVINIGNGYTVKANVLHSAQTTNTAASFGRYTYNVNGTLDLSNSNTISGLIPHVTAPESVVALNVNGVLRTGSQFRAVSTAAGTSAGKVVLTIGEGGLVDAVKAGDSFAVAPNYFVIRGNGSLKRRVAGTPVLFPISASTGNYSPVTLTNAGAADNFSVTVKNSFDHPVPDAARVVNKQWRITEDMEGGSLVTAKFGWQSADQAAAFDPAQLLAVMQYKGAWQAEAATSGGSGTLEDPYTAAITGLNSFSDFAVANLVKDSVQPANPPACGNDSNKVLICHKGKTICISKDAVQAHLNHGDHWGACNGTAAAMEFVDDDKTGKQLQVKVYPNPAHDDVTVYMEKAAPGATVELFTVSGLLVRAAKLVSRPQNVSVKGLPAGVYLVVVRSGIQVTTERIIIQ